VYVRRRFTFSREIQKRKGLSNAAIWLVNPPMGDPTHGSGILSGVYLTLVSPIGRFMLAEAIRQAGTRTAGPVRKRDHLRNIVRDIVPAARFALSFSYRRFVKRGRKAPGFFVRSAANVYPLVYHGEHLPNAESRVILTSEPDALGMPRIRTEMRFSEEDVAAVGRAMRELDAALREAGVGHLEFLYEDIASGVWQCLRGASGFHQTGTTRMASDAADGVVDANLAVFGTDNLFVASTSTFPTSSQANPTLTGVAFAVRLAEHLDRQLRSSHGLATETAHAGEQSASNGVLVSQPLRSSVPLGAERLCRHVDGGEPGGGALDPLRVIADRNVVGTAAAAGAGHIGPTLAPSADAVASSVATRPFSFRAPPNA
jgi:hypothetical protein